MGWGVTCHAETTYYDYDLVVQMFSSGLKATKENPQLSRRLDERRSLVCHMDRCLGMVIFRRGSCDSSSCP